METRPPTAAEMTRFWEAQTASLYTCHDCGRQDSRSYVQPQHPYYVGGEHGLALCTDCITRRNTETAIARKRELDAAPRCEIDNCRRRGAWRSYGVLLCGHHLANVKRAHNRNSAGAGFMGLFMAASYTQAAVLDMARKG